MVICGFATSLSSEKYENFGKAIYYTEMSIDITEIGEDYKKGDIAGIIQNSLDATMSSIGEFGGAAGFTADVAYKASKWWKRTMDSTIKTISQQYNSATGENLWISNSNIYMGYGE